MMNTKKQLLGRALITLLLIGSGAVAVGCGARQQSARDDQNKVSPVSETAPKLEPRERTAPAVLSSKPVASVGDCGPRYANGLRGACINNQPCRGIGVLDASGKAVCACYAKIGGCSESERCDAIKKACVPEKESGFGRAPED
jgi:hypothetical protein